MPPEVWMWIGISVILFLFVVGAPMWVAFLGGCTLLYLFMAKLPATTIPLMALNSVHSWILISVPMFILLGNIMSASGGAAALYDLVRAFTGRLKAGMGIAAIFACALFGLLCGSTVATALAVGTIVTPELMKHGYTRPHAAAITGVAGCLGIMIPPSIAMIVLGEVTNTSVGALFMAGLLPGIMAAIFLSVTCYFVVRRDPDIRGAERSFTWKERGTAIVRATPAFLIPLAILGSIYMGIATPTESAAVAVVAALLVGVFFYRGLNWKNLKEAARDAVRSSAAIYCIIFGAVIFGRVLGFMKIPQNISAAIGALGLGPNMFMMLFLALFLFFGMIFDAFALYFVCLPPLLGTIHMYGFNFVWFCIVFVFVIMIGQVTPPVGITLYAAATGSQAPADQVIKRSIPYLLSQIVSCVVVIFIPQIALFLPSLIR